MAKGKLSKLFKGKDTYGEEIKEAKAIKSGKITPSEYAKGEKSEEAKKMKCGGSTKKMAFGGTASLGGMGRRGAPMPQQSAAGKAAQQATIMAQQSRGQLPQKPALASAPMPSPQMVKPTTPYAGGAMGAAMTGKPMKKGGCMAKGGGIEVRGKTKGRMI